MTKTIRQIVTLAGGTAAIAAATENTNNGVTNKAVQKWLKPGATIPDRHWSTVVELAVSGGKILCANDLYLANENVRKNSAPRPKSAAGQGVSP